MYKKKIPSFKEYLEPGNTDTEAPESTRNSLSDRMSFRKRRVELKQQEEDWQVGREYPPARLLVSQKGTRFPTVVSLLTMLLVEPAEFGRSRRSGRQSWGWRTLGERRRLGRDWRPQGAGGN